MGDPDGWRRPGSLICAIPIAEILTPHRALQERIRIAYGGEEGGFEAWLAPLMHRYASFVHLLPATAHAHFREPGGLLRVGLEVGLHAVQIADGQLFEASGTVLERRALAPRWRTAAFLAGLTAELHRPVMELAVTADDGARWIPLRGPLADWLAAGVRRHYIAHWIHRSEPVAAAALVALFHLVDAALSDYLAASKPCLVAEVISAIAGNPASADRPLARVLQQTLARVVDRDLRERPPDIAASVATATTFDGVARPNRPPQVPDPGAPSEIRPEAPAAASPDRLSEIVSSSRGGTPERPADVAVSVERAPVVTHRRALSIPATLNPVIAEAVSEMLQDASGAEHVLTPQGIFMPLSAFARAGLDTGLVVRTFHDAGLLVTDRGRKVQTLGEGAFERARHSRERQDPWRARQPTVRQLTRPARMFLRKYEMLWRPAFEGYAAIAWCLAGAWVVASAAVDSRAVWPATVLAGLCAALALVRGAAAYRVLRTRASLSGRAIETMDSSQLLEHWGEHRHEWVYLGSGFQWLPEHSQRLYELKKIDFRRLAVPWPLRRLVGVATPPQPETEMGLPFIHGVEVAEDVIRVPRENLAGNLLLLGATRAGKTVLLRSLVFQAIHRGDAVIIVDPKNDPDLKRLLVETCSTAGRRDRFFEFHPAFPERSARFDPMYNWSKATELASRIQAIMPPDTSGSFSAFGWQAVNVVVQALVEQEERPNLVKIRRYVESGIDPLLKRSLERLFERELPERWRTEVGPFVRRAERGELRGPEKTTAADLVGYATYFEQRVQPVLARERVPEALQAQLAVFHHPREHYQKITANLLPILSMLTTGNLGRSLSPDPLDIDDPRPILNLDKVVEQRLVFYMCLDSLPDKAVASALGSILLADLAALSGIRYNLQITTPRVSLFVDELSEVINEPLVQIANKAAGSGVMTTCATQTLADLTARLGNEAKARMVLGNFNNLVAFRSKDRPTQDYVVEQLGQAYIQSVSGSYTTHADEHLAEYSGSVGTTLREALEDTIPADVVGKLPSMQFFAAVSGGRLYKGRIPVLVSPQAPSPPA